MSKEVPVDSRGPVFISYRHNDGSAIVDELEWLLRAAGIPAWRDKSDLPLGDILKQLKRALDGDYSGSVLVVTEDVKKSEIIKMLEAPKFIELHNKHDGFILAIVNVAGAADDDSRYDQPDKLLELEPGTLRNVTQYLIGSDPCARRSVLLSLVRDILLDRARAQRRCVKENQQTLSIGIQTQNSASANDRGEQFDIRVRPAYESRLPDPQGLRDLSDTIRFLPDAVTEAGANRVRITGGAHLPIAFALGASLPSTRIGYMEVVDQKGTIWTGNIEAHIPSPPLLEIVREWTGPQTDSSIAVFLDLMPERSDAPFDLFLKERASTLRAWQHIRGRDNALWDASSAATIAAEAAARLRKLSNANANAEIHLFLRCPFPLAVLIGRLTNTLCCVLYQFDQISATYSAVLRVRTSLSIEPIE